MKTFWRLNILKTLTIPDGRTSFDNFVAVLKIFDNDANVIINLRAETQPGSSAQSANESEREAEGAREGERERVR